MDKELLAKNIKHYCEINGIKPTPAVKEAGVGQNLLQDILKGKATELWRIVDLAAFLGVTTSDLVGDTRASPQEAELLRHFRQLNQEGRERLLDHADDMVRGGKYIQSGQDILGQEETVG